MVTKRTYRRKGKMVEMPIQDWADLERKRTKSLDYLLKDRQTTHGKFADNAATSQRIKKLMHRSEGWQGLTFIQQEALEMIALKISRILTGNAAEKDHWVDIAGYSELVVKALNESPPPISAPDTSV